MKQRVVHPEFFTDERVASVPVDARLLLIGMWCMANDDGVLTANCRRIKYQVFPLDDDVTPLHLTELVVDLVDAGLVEFDGDSLVIPGFREQQPTSRSLANIAGPTAGLTCVYCGVPAGSWDHVLPRTRGGTDTADNLVPACRPCNSRKRHRTPEEWWAATNPGQPFPSDWPRAGDIEPSTACPG